MRPGWFSIWFCICWPGMSSFVKRLPSLFRYRNGAVPTGDMSMPVPP